MATKAEISDRIDEAVAAMDSGDWSTALTKLLGAKAMLAGMADVGWGGDQLRYDRNAIDSLIDECRRKISAESAGTGTGGIQRTKFRFGGIRPSSCED